MDTREKIITAAEAAQIADAMFVSGYFDPMTAAHAARIAELKDGRKLVVLIATPADPILSARARAELVAGLRAVDYVVDSPGGLTPKVRLEEEDAARLEKLIGHVHARQQAAS